MIYFFGSNFLALFHAVAWHREHWKYNFPVATCGIAEDKFDVDQKAFFPEIATQKLTLTSLHCMFFFLSLLIFLKSFKVRKSFIPSVTSQLLSCCVFWLADAVWCIVWVIDACWEVTLLRMLYGLHNAEVNLLKYLTEPWWWSGGLHMLQVTATVLKWTLFNATGGEPLTRDFALIYVPFW